MENLIVASNKPSTSDGHSIQERAVKQDINRGMDIGDTSDIDVLVRMIAHAYSMDNVMHLISPMTSKQITPLAMDSKDSYLTVFVNSQTLDFVFSNKKKQMYVVAPKIMAKWAREHLKFSMRVFSQFVIPALWNNGNVIRSGCPHDVKVSVLVTHIGLLNLGIGENRQRDCFKINREQYNRISFSYKERVISVEETPDKNECKCTITLSNTSGDNLKKSFDIQYTLSMMLLAIQQLFLLEFSSDSWRTSRDTLIYGVDLFVSDTFVMPFINLLSNIYNYDVDDIKNLSVASFDLHSMELYQTGYFAIFEAIPRLVEKAISNFPRTHGAAFTSIYSHMYGSYDNFITGYERSFYKNLGRILYICLRHGIQLDPSFSNFIIKSLLIFRISELVDSDSIHHIITRKMICIRLWEIYKITPLKQMGIAEILHNDKDTFSRIYQKKLVVLANTFFIYSYWWQSKNLSEKNSDLKERLIHECWPLMQQSISEVLYREYDRFIDPLYTIARSFASLTLTNDHVGHNHNITKYNNSLRLLDEKFSQQYFPIMEFCAESSKLNSMLVKSPVRDLQLSAVVGDPASEKKTQWLNDTLEKDNNGQFTNELWQFLAPTHFEGCAKPTITLCTTRIDIGRMIYAVPCENKLYVSQGFYKQQRNRWYSVGCFSEEMEESLKSSFIQSVKDSIDWSSGYPTKLKLATILEEF